MAGLDHQAQLHQFACGTPCGLIGEMISGRRVDWDVLAGKMQDKMAVSGRQEWDDVLGVVVGIGRARRTKELPGWCIPDLCTMRADLRRLWCSGPHDDYVLAWKVYQARIIEAHDGDLGRQLAHSNDPDIFRRIDKLKLLRTLPAIDSRGSYVTFHCGISDLMVEQLGLTGAASVDDCPPFVDRPLPHHHEKEIVDGLASSEIDTSPSIDKVTYWFIRCLWKQWPDRFDCMCRRAIVFPTTPGFTLLRLV